MKYRTLYSVFACWGPKVLIGRKSATPGSDEKSESGEDELLQEHCKLEEDVIKFNLAGVDDRGKLHIVYAAPGAGKSSLSDSRVTSMFYSAQLLDITANKYKQKTQQKKFSNIFSQ